MSKTHLSVGSNIGNRQKFIKQAIEHISVFCKITAISSIYETAPWGKLNQPKFLNICLSAETSLYPGELLEKLKSIETGLGRTHTTKWAQREIDIDILFFDDIVSKNPDPILPHPRIEERAFVLIPLAEIEPDFMHPVLKKTIRELAEDIGSEGVRRLPRVMGILNATPDSFSDGGELKTISRIKRKVRGMIEDGVDIIDIGGESTRPGHHKITAEEEIDRVLPALKAVREISSHIPVSIDTQKARVAEKALEAGANIINDISALSDSRMSEVIKKFNCQVILMRNQPLQAADLIGSCKRQFEEIVKNCLALGLDKKKIILDPGLGFGDLKTGDFSALPGGDPAANTQLVTSIERYDMGLPVLIGASRKRFLGEMSGRKDAKKRLSESLAFAVLAKHSNADIIRVHDVKETIEMLSSEQETGQS